jgi:hypothetical protein
MTDLVLAQPGQVVVLFIFKVLRPKVLLWIEMNSCNSIITHWADPPGGCLMLLALS